MMKLITFLVALFTAVPALAQTPVLTNADLGHRLSPDRRTVTAAELESLRAGQFRLPAQYDGPTVIYVSSYVAPQPLAPYRPLSEPFIAPYYLGWPGYGYGYGRTRTTDRVRGASQPPADSISPHRPEQPVRIPAATGSVRVRR